MSIEIQNAVKRYGRKTVIDDVSLSIRPGEIVSFVGANGVGKSTLLSMISRLLPLDGGRILLDGRDIHNMKSNDVAKKMAILRQSNHTDLRLRVHDLVSFGRFPYSHGHLNDRDRKIIDEAVDYLDLSSLRYHYINELSGGQRQRAYIAMVLAQDTDYILLDEPLNNLDMKHAVHMMKLLQRMCREKGKTIVLVIHDINFASVYSDTIFALKEGRLAFSGCPGDLMTDDCLENIFGFNMPIHEAHGHRLGLYFIA